MADYQNKVSTRFEASGQEAYKKAMDEARSSVSLAQAEMRNATAAYEANDTSAAALQARYEGLQGVIEAQQDKVSVLKDRLNELESSGTGNESTIKKLKTALNNAEAALKKTEENASNLKEQLDANEASTGKLKAALEKAKPALTAVATVLGETFKLACEGAAAAVTAVSAAMAKGVTTAYNWATAAGVFADDTLTLAEQTGISAEDLQKWTYASQFIDTEVSTITGSMRRMIMAMGDAQQGTDTALIKFDALGVSFANADGSLRDTEDVFWDAVTALGGIESQSQRDAYAMDLFGRSAQELNPLINAGREAFEAYGEEAEAAGIVMTEEQLKTAGAFNDTQNVFNSSLTGMKNSVGVLAADLFSPLLTGASGAMGQITSALADGFQPEDAQVVAGAFSDFLEQGAIDIEQIVSSLIPTFKNLLSALMGSLTELLPTILPELLGSVTEIIGTLSDSLPEVVTALLGALLKIDWGQLFEQLSGSIADTVVQVVDLLLSPDTLQSMFEIGGKLITSLASGLWTVGKGLITSIWDGIKGLFSNIFGGDDDLEELYGDYAELAKNSTLAADVVMGAATGGITNWTQLDETIRYGREVLASGEELPEGMRQFGSMFSGAQAQLWDTLREGSADDRAAAAVALKNLGFTDIISSLAAQDQRLAEEMENYDGTLEEALDWLGLTAEDVTAQSAAEETRAAAEAMGELEQATESYYESIESLSKELGLADAPAGQGLADGMAAGTDAVTKAAEQLGSDTVDAALKQLSYAEGYAAGADFAQGISEAVAEFTTVGESMMAALAEGIANGAGAVADAAKKAAASAYSAALSLLDGGGGGSGGGSGGKGGTTVVVNTSYSGAYTPSEARRFGSALAGQIGGSLAAVGG